MKNFATKLWKEKNPISFYDESFDQLYSKKAFRREEESIN